MAGDCVFCKIVAGEIPCAKIYEDEDLLAFLDVGPVSEGHTLVIPKRHFEKLHECPAELIAAIGSQLGRIAEAVVETVNCDGYNVLCNVSRAAGQLVDHVHFHIIPRTESDGIFSKWPGGKYKKSRMEEIASVIRENLL